MPPAVATPNILVDPGFLWIAPLGTAAPSNTVTDGKFSDAVPAAYLPLGATTEGTEFAYSTDVEPIEAAEFFDPIRYATVARSGSVAFNLMNWTLSNYRRALNGGVAALVATGVAGSELTTFEPPDPGNEVRAMLLWESTDSTLRMLFRQVLQGGEVTTSARKAPDVAAIPCTFNLEVPTAGKPFTIWGAGTTRV
jgi:hypothetical protein